MSISTLPFPDRDRSRLASRATLLSLLLLSGLPTLATAQLALVGGTVHERSASPGSRYQGTIRVTNTGPMPVEARVYQTDLRTSADGSTLFATPGTEPRSNAAWITISPMQVTVPAKGEALVAYEVSVPAGSGEQLRGTWWSTIMVEGAQAADPQTQGSVRRAPGVALQVNVRHAVQVATTIPGAAPARAELRAPRIILQDGHPVLQVDVVNAGAVAFRPAMRLELFDGQGAVRDTQQVQRGLLYPGSSLRQAFALESLPAGEYRALVIADAGGAEMFGAQFRFRR